MGNLSVPNAPYASFLVLASQHSLARHRFSLCSWPTQKKIFYDIFAIHSNDWNLGVTFMIITLYAFFTKYFIGLKCMQFVFIAYTLYAIVFVKTKPSVWDRTTFCTSTLPPFSKVCIILLTPRQYLHASCQENSDTTPNVEIWWK